MARLLAFIKEVIRPCQNIGSPGADIMNKLQANMTIGVALMMAPLQSRICTGVGKLGIKYRGVQGGQKGESGIRLYKQSGSDGFFSGKHCVNGH